MIINKEFLSISGWQYDIGRSRIVKKTKNTYPCSHCLHNIPKGKLAVSYFMVSKKMLCYFHLRCFYDRLESYKQERIDINCSLSDRVIECLDIWKRRLEYYIDLENKNTLEGWIKND